MTVELNDALFAKLAGWEAMKQARALVAAGAVLEAQWQPPRLLGRVREGNSSYPAGLVIRSALDADNLCPCRTSRQRGLICAHSVAVGLHYLNGLSATTVPTTVKPAASQPPKPAAVRAAPKALRRAAPGDQAEPLEISLILPPNFGEALARGQVMIVLEGHWRRGRTPLNALPRDIPFSLSAQDADLLEALESLNEGDTPGMIRLNHTHLAGLLPRLIGHPRVSLGKGPPLQILREPWRPKAHAALQSNGEIIVATCGISAAGLIPGSPTWGFDGRSLRPLALPAGLEAALNSPLRITRSHVPRFLNVDWRQLVDQGQAEADFAPEDFSFDTLRPRFTLHLAGNLTTIEAHLACHYGDRSAADLAADSPWFVDPDCPTRYLARDVDAERGAFARLLRAGFSGPDPRGRLHLKGQDLVLNFFAREYPHLEREWQVTLEERLERTAANNFDRLEPRFAITPSGEQWFELEVAYDTRAGETLSAADVQRLLRSGQSHARLKSGKYLLVDTGAVEELQEVLLDCAPQQQAGRYRLDNTQSGFLDATLRRQPQWQIQAPIAWQQRAALQRGQIALNPPPLGTLESVLRPYQKQGVAWLRFLRENGFGGILADEMGLGKTLQVLAHLVTLADRAANDGAPDRPAPTGPSLVVCPTSLVFNWAAEAARFTPTLRVQVLCGADRQEHFAELPNHDLAITSYALLRRDTELYRDREFDTVILDEAQHIKNRQTQNAQAVKAIRARHRLVLTGTPLENSVLDLWSIFDFLMPGYLGTAPDFRERYEWPIVRDRSQATQDRLARRLQPFLLRRLKRAVAADLPARIEQISTCELSPEQRALYQQVLAASRRELSDTASPASARSRMLVLTTLLRLRQICCDLRLLPAPPANRPAIPETRQPAEAHPRHPPEPPTSGKLELFEELLEEVLDGGHRVLVFSQFTRMLGLLRESLSSRGLTCCYLDGSTANRAEVVDRFQSDRSIPVFLISLKAGGVGLNLTGADTVIHFDPWWNPAVEAQATDRAHRIGQKNVVTSYKLITRGTVEEKILNLQTRKRGLLEGVLGDDESLVSALSWEELQALLHE
ncbi:MAG: DEAD/DEAH box helicase [Verrucomicrobia bacterium]|nr:DEAD/DEAH box helicase [Verrucomicrobiota bacterium]